MATTREITISVVEEAKDGSRSVHLEREPITGLGDSKGNNAYHKPEGVDAGAVQAMTNSFKLNPNDLRFEIEWKPPSWKSLLFHDLNKKKSNLTIFIYWTIKNDNSLTYSKSIVIDDGKVNKSPQSKGTAPNAIQHVEFTGKFKPTK